MTNNFINVTSVKCVEKTENSKHDEIDCKFIRHTADGNLRLAELDDLLFEEGETKSFTLFKYKYDSSDIVFFQMIERDTNPDDNLEILRWNVQGADQEHLQMTIWVGNKKLPGDPAQENNGKVQTVTVKETENDAGIYEVSFLSYMRQLSLGQFCPSPGDFFHIPFGGMHLGAGPDNLLVTQAGNNPNTNQKFVFRGNEGGYNLFLAETDLALCYQSTDLPAVFKPVDEQPPCIFNMYYQSEGENAPIRFAVAEFEIFLSITNRPGVAAMFREGFEGPGTNFHAHKVA